MPVPVVPTVLVEVKILLSGELTAPMSVNWAKEPIAGPVVLEVAPKETSAPLLF